MSRTPNPKQCLFETLENRAMLSAAPAVRVRPRGSNDFLVGVNRNVSRLNGNQVEAKIAINPTNPNNIVTVGVNEAGGGTKILISRSNDGGKTWRPSTYGGADDGLNINGPRPDARVAFDSFGNCYVCYLVPTRPDEVRVELARSSDGGKSFDAVSAVQGSGTFADDPEIATGIDARRRSRQVIWISYCDEGDGHVYAVRTSSTGLGKFAGIVDPIQISDQPGNYSSIAIGAKGQVAIAWESPEDGSGPANIMVDSDADGAGRADSFGQDVAAVTTNVGGDDPIPAQPDRHIDAEGQIAFDHEGRLYLAYTDENPAGSGDTDIMLRHSDDLGGSWSRPIFVNDDTGHTSQFLPAISVDPKSDQIGISWLDARNSSDNTSVQEFATVSTDRGVSVLPNVRVSGGTSSQAGANPTDGSDDTDFGDSTGAVFFDRKLIVAWADNSNITHDNPAGADGDFDIYTSVITVVAPGAKRG